MFGIEQVASFEASSLQSPPVTEHRSEVPVEQHTVPHWTLILAKLKSLNVIMLLSQAHSRG